MTATTREVFVTGTAGLDLQTFELLSFDCYGTLIDWETGILSALRPVLAGHGLRTGDDELLEAYATAEARVEEGPYLPYAEILTRVMDRLGQRLGFAPTGPQRRCLVDSLPHWPVFADTVPALRVLKRHCRLAVISNVDKALFAQTARRLEVDFDWVLTAEEVRAYKPSPVVFDHARKKAGAAGDCWLHVAQSLYHDIAPANRMGLATLWVNRRWDRPGSGATPLADARPSWEVPSLEALVAILNVEL